MQSLLLDKNNDFVIINKDGISIVALGSEEVREVRDENDDPRKIHSLESMNYLKFDPSDYVYFSFSKSNH